MTKRKVQLFYVISILSLFCASIYFINRRTRNLDLRKNMVVENNEDKEKWEEKQRDKEQWKETDVENDKKNGEDGSKTNNQKDNQDEDSPNQDKNENTTNQSSNQSLNQSKYGVSVDDKEPKENIEDFLESMHKMHMEDVRNYLPEGSMAYSMPNLVALPGKFNSGFDGGDKKRMYDEQMDSQMPPGFFESQNNSDFGLNSSNTGYNNSNTGYNNQSNGFEPTTSEPNAEVTRELMNMAKSFESLETQRKDKNGDTSDQKDKSKSPEKKTAGTDTDKEKPENEKQFIPFNRDFENNDKVKDETKKDEKQKEGKQKDEKSQGIKDKLEVNGKKLLESPADRYEDSPQRRKSNSLDKKTIPFNKDEIDQDKIHNELFGSKSDTAVASSKDKKENKPPVNSDRNILPLPVPFSKKPGKDKSSKSSLEFEKESDKEDETEKEGNPKSHPAVLRQTIQFSINTPKNKKENEKSDNKKDEKKSAAAIHIVSKIIPLSKDKRKPADSLEHSNGEIALEKSMNDNHQIERSNSELLTDNGIIKPENSVRKSDEETEKPLNPSNAEKISQNYTESTPIFRDLPQDRENEQLNDEKKHPFKSTANKKKENPRASKNENKNGGNKKAKPANSEKKKQPSKNIVPIIKFRSLRVEATRKDKNKTEEESESDDKPQNNQFTPQKFQNSPAFSSNSPQQVNDLHEESTTEDSLEEQSEEMQREPVFDLDKQKLVPPQSINNMFL